MVDVVVVRVSCGGVVSMLISRVRKIRSFRLRVSGLNNDLNDLRPELQK
ncbi:hypothetical protein BN2497_4361 [Janthinobacterium sp. CG23_2]|nr:hypothetical protein BN2497_4361 [Janthinobacterium sp. CG23_2]CUU28578.1 hypothetical protein BN3177_4361 [Janthinobacterium sp. CG23_2]